jgi:hypothetical protein
MRDGFMAVLTARVLLRAAGKPRLAAGKPGEVESGEVCHWCRPVLSEDSKAERGTDLPRELVARVEVLRHGR